MSEEYLQPFTYAGSNITFAVFQSSQEEARDGWKINFLEDALQVISSSLRIEDVDSFPTNLTCQGTASWKKGNNIIRQMKSVSPSFCSLIFSHPEKIHGESHRSRTCAYLRFPINFLPEWRQTQSLPLEKEERTLSLKFVRTSLGIISDY